MVFLMQVFVDRKHPGVVVALSQANSVTAGRVPVLVPVVQLILLLVEAVHDVARAAAGQVGRARWEAVRSKDPRLRAGTGILRDVRLDRERRVGEVTGERGVGRRTRGVGAVGG